MYILKTQITEKEAQYLEEILGDIREKWLPEKSGVENIREALTYRYPQMKSTKVQEIAEELVNGINGFYDYLKNEQKLESWSLRLELDKLEGDLNKKYEYAVNVYAGITAIDAAVVAGNGAENIVDEKFKQILDEELYLKPGNVNQEDLDEIIKKADLVVNSSKMGFAGLRDTENLLRKIPEGTEVLSEEINRIASELCNKEIMAAAAYIAYLDGQLSCFPKNASPEMVGVGVAMGLVRDDIIRRHSLGEVTWDAVVKTLKWIGIIVSILLIEFTTVCFATWGILSLVAFILTPAGQITAGIAAVSALSIAAYRFAKKHWDKINHVVGTAIETVFEPVSKIVQKIGYCIADIYQKVLEFFTEKIKPAVINNIDKTWNFICTKASKIKSVPQGKNIFT